MERNALRILRRKQLEDKIGLSRSAIYGRLDPGSPYFDASFPRPVTLGGGKNPPVGWLEAEVDAWLTAQVVKREAA
jgi:prophage regulatory protein